MAPGNCLGFPTSQMQPEAITFFPPPDRPFANAKALTVMIQDFTPTFPRNEKGRAMQDQYHVLF